ncbi:MAG: hypothetical protein R3A45_11880 [Bdellovibrionota bacterium]
MHAKGLAEEGVFLFSYPRGRSFSPRFYGFLLNLSLYWQTLEAIQHLMMKIMMKDDHQNFLVIDAEDITDYSNNFYK